MIIYCNKNNNSITVNDLLQISYNNKDKRYLVYNIYTSQVFCYKKSFKKALKYCINFDDSEYKNILSEGHSKSLMLHKGNDIDIEYKEDANIFIVGKYIIFKSRTPKTYSTYNRSDINCRNLYIGDFYNCFMWCLKN